MSMEFKSIIYEKKPSIAKITINRPDVRNAMNIETRRELKEVLRDAESDEDVKVVVITGIGGNFCSGADINEFLKMSRKQAEEYAKKYGTAILGKIIADMEKVVVAAVDGYCLGGGCELALACDIVIATDRAQFGSTEMRIGLFPGGGATQLMTKLIGIKKTKELIFTGNIISAEEAERIGLINRVVSADKLDEEVDKLVKVLLDKSPIMLKLAKESINRALEVGLTAGLDYERVLWLSGWDTEDRIEGLRAFLEKRKPVFKGY